MARIVVTNPIFPEVERRLREVGDVIVNDRQEPWSREELTGHLRDADALMAFMTDSVDDALIGGCPALKSSPVRSKAMTISTSMPAPGRAFG